MFPPAADSVRRVLRPGRWYESMSWMGKLWQNPIFGLGNFRIFFSTHPLNRSSMMLAWFNPLCSSCVRFNPACWYVLMVNFHARGSLPWNSGSFLGPTAQEHLVGTTKWFLSWVPILYYIYIHLFYYNIYIYIINIITMEIYLSQWNDTSSSRKPGSVYGFVQGEEVREQIVPPSAGPQSLRDQRLSNQDIFFFF